MKDFDNKYFYERVDQVIRMKMTGSPKEFAYKLGISESHLYRVINKLKEKAFCPISFDKERNSYIYQYEGKLEIRFCYELDKKEQKKVNGGMLFNLKNSLSKNESAVNYFWCDKLLLTSKFV